MVFQSTLPAWGETTVAAKVATVNGNFNPLSPHGERRFPPLALGPPGRFQSTLPAWGETRRPHAPGRPYPYFNPLSPHGERRFVLLRPASHRGISIHSPRMGRDLAEIDQLLDE